MPGIPFAFIGKTDHVSWGLTVNYAETVDLFIEEVDFVKRTYVNAGKTEKLKVRREEINIKGEPSIWKDYFSTERGPIVELSPDLGSIVYHYTEVYPQNVSFSFKWVMHKQDLNIVSALNKI